MKLAPRHSGPATLALLAASAFAMGSIADATELGSAAHPTSLRIHSAEQTLSENCAWMDGRLWFTIPGGPSWELVTSTSDSVISNPGDGEFHPFAVSEVEDALAGVRFPLQRIAAEIYILPYPRRLGLDSAAGPGLILLSPGVRPIASEQQCAEFVHELGHVVQYSLMPDADNVSWERYRSLRGIEDAAVFCSDASHADRPHEIFAEDFRALFGPQAANTAGTIENSELAYPTEIPGLSAFVLALADAPARTGTLAVLGDGSQGAVRLARTGFEPAVLDLFDVTGRRLASLEPESGAVGATWLWNGRDAAGRDVRGAVVFARARDGKGGTTRIIRLP